MTLAELEQLLQTIPELKPHADFLLGVAKSSVSITVTKNGPNGFESKFGGKPLVPTDFEWPKHASGEYKFLGHINFSEISDCPSPLPSSGLLSLFYAEDEEGEVFWRDDGYILGCYWPDLSDLKVMQPPYKKTPSAKRILFTSGIDIPRHQELIENAPFDLDQIMDLIEGFPTSHMLGYPTHNSLAYDPTPGEEWCSLLTIDSYDQFDWCWHDADKLMIFVEKEKLAIRDFSHLKSDAG